MSDKEKIELEKKLQNLQSGYNEIYAAYKVALGELDKLGYKPVWTKHGLEWVVRFEVKDD